MSTAFWQLVHRDLHLFKYDYFKDALNSLIWLICTTVVFGYVLSAMGIGQSYGAFMQVGSIASLSLFRCVHSIPALLGDIEGEGPISYYLTLPMKQYMVFVRYAVSFSIKAAVLSLSLTIISKLLLWNVLDLSSFSIFKYLIIFLVMHLFVGFFTLLVTAYTPSMRYIENVWTRVIFPIWFLGGYQFSWLTLRESIPVLAYINLINPMMYILEAFRAAFLGQARYVNFWICCGMILLATVASGYFGVRKFLSRLDCI